MGSPYPLALKALFPRILSFIPSLSGGARRKGEHGKVLIVGGSFEYVGAPVYAGMAALRTGADLAWVACSQDAAVPIKVHSAELIVLPVIPSSDEDSGVEKAMEALLPVLNRVHSIVLGPGLGRSKGAFAVATSIINFAKSKSPQLPLVLDGDALFLLSTNASLIAGHGAVLLTPNAIEFERLAGLDLSGVVVLRKGEIDRVGGMEVAWGGSPRRCGGQGDILAGCAGTFLAWASSASSPAQTLTKEAIELCAVGASILTRAAAADAFSVKHRGTLTPDILAALPQAFHKHFEAP